MEKINPNPIQLPPGFRFHPSDEELIVHYLRKKANKTPLPASVVADVELYKLNPWDLPKISLFGDEEWFFFTPRDRKYPNGLRPNRMAASGYWKATGIDKPILTSCGSKVIGVKKALVFYIGRPPKGNKTDWIMHEYRLPESDQYASASSWSNKKHNNHNSMRLDEWVLCRVRQKTISTMPIGNFLDENLEGSSCSTVQKLDHKQNSSSTPNTDLVRENYYVSQEDYCQELSFVPFLFGNFTDTEVCEDNYNVGKKRKLQIGHANNGDEHMNIDQSVNKKKVMMNNRDCYDEKQLSGNDDCAGTGTGSDHGGIMISSYHLAQNNHVDQSMMIYQDLCNSLAFT